MTVRGLLEAIPQLNTGQITAALFHLRKVGAADAIEQDGGLWWYLTPGSDARCRTMEERRVEEPGHRRPRRQARPRKVAQEGLGPQGQEALEAIAERASRIAGEGAE